MAIQVYGANSIPGLEGISEAIGGAFGKSLSDGLSIQQLSELIDAGKLDPAVAQQMGPATVGISNAGPVTPITLTTTQAPGSTAAPENRFDNAFGQFSPSGGAPAGSISQADFDKAVRTVYGEAGNQGAAGRKAVAGVIANRARQSGQSLSSVVLAPNQFEPWSNPAARARMESLSPADPTYQQIASEIAPVLSGQEPSPVGAADHFYAPKAQAALGRPAPSWDNGSGQDLGDHRFFALGYGGKAPSGAAQAADAMSGQYKPVTNSDLDALANNPATRQIAGQIAMGQQKGSVYAMGENGPVQVGGAIDNDTMKKLLRIKHPLAQAIVEKELERRYTGRSADGYSFIQTGDGSIVRTSRDGSFQVVMRGNKDARTNAQKDYEYGLQNPGFVAAQENSRPQTNVTVNGDSAAGQRFFFDQLKERRDQAAAAAADINAINAARGQLDQGIISGAGANWKLQAAKMASSVLGMPEVTDQVAATEAFQAAVGQRVLSIVKGLGAGTGISNADRDFASQMAGGNISLNEESIRKIFDIAEKANRAKIGGYRGMAQQVLSGQPGLTGFMPLLDVEDPAAYAPPQPAASAATPTQQQAAPPVDGARKAADGKWYVPDPSRPGKYLMVQ